MRIINLIKKILAKFGISVSRIRGNIFSPDISKEYVAIYKKVSPYTMTSSDRLFALCDAVRYIQDAKVSGDIVECGVWKGGSMMAIAEMLLANPIGIERNLYLYDTFSGMSQPGDEDIDHAGEQALNLLTSEDLKTRESVLCYAPLEQVKNAMDLTEYPVEKIHYLKGRVEETLREFVPNKIALLRLDTDWYESTKYEMEYLFPKLEVGGVIIIDDYGHWMGAKKAVDEYLRQHGVRLLLNRIDYTGRIGVKTH